MSGDIRAEMSANFSKVFEKVDALRDMHGKKLDDLKESQAELREEVIEIKTSCIPCREIVRQHEADLRGANGEGMKTRVTLLEHVVESVTQEQTRIGDPAKRSKRAEQTSVGAGLTALAALVWHLLSAWFGGGSK